MNKLHISIVCILMQSNAFASTGIFGPSIFANNGSTANLSGNINLVGVPGGYKGIIAETGGKLYLGSDLPNYLIKIDLKGDGATGIYATDNLSFIELRSRLTSILSQGADSTGVDVSNLASINAKSLTINMTGDRSIGIKKRGDSQLSIDLLSLQQYGSQSIAVFGSELTKLNLSNATINSSGNNSVGVLSDDSTIDLSKSTVTISNGTGIKAINSGLVNVEYSAIDSSGGGLVASNGGVINLNGEVTIIDKLSKAIISDGNTSVVSGNGIINISGDIDATNEGKVDLTLENKSILKGKTTTDSLGNINLTLNNSTWIATGNSSLTNISIDNGVFYLADPNDVTLQNNTIQVNGDYNSTNGTLYFRTKLGDDNSLTDRLIVKGDTSGNTLVNVENAGGTGAPTLNGIELISVYGKSEGTFSQSGRIVAGAFDYLLVRGEDGNNKNWYLSNKKENPVTGVTPPESQVPDKPESIPSEPENQNSGNTPPDELLVRPESGSYLANITSANNMFIMRLHDRLGEPQYTDALTGERKVASMWLRQIGGHNNFREDQGQLKTQSNRYVVQLGGDIAQWTANGLDRLHIGMMFGYGSNSSNTYSNVSGYGSKGLVEGYSVGLYSTWYSNDAEKTGLYVDSWMLYSWFDNQVKGEGIASENYNSQGTTFSLESGYTSKIRDFVGSQGSSVAWYVQPQVQAVWMGVKADNHVENNGSNIKGSVNGNIMTRVGIRTYLKGHSAIDSGKERLFQPFIETNWIHNTKNYTTTMNGIDIKQDGVRNIGEIKVGLESQLKRDVNLWGNIGVQVGAAGYNDSAAMIGVKYLF